MKALIFCALSFCAATAMAGSADDTFDNGNRAFAEGDFAQAIADYQSLVDSGHYSEPIFFNLGNAYAKAGQIGPAVLSYQRALFIAPQDRAVKANLALAASATPRSTWYERAAYTLSMSSWSFFIFGGFILIALAALLGRFTSRKKSAWTLGLGGATSVLAATAALAIWWPVLNESVVIAPAQARLSPFATAHAELTLGEGQTVTVKRTHGGFALITTDSGQSGWVEAKDIAPIVAQPWRV